ncbi:unnamed protein product [Heterobilharzia americana]|nr:unnamed protein product [Heterobilharzia americana]
MSTFELLKKLEFDWFTFKYVPYSFNKIQFIGDISSVSCIHNLLLVYTREKYFQVIDEHLSINQLLLAECQRTG